MPAIDFTGLAVFTGALALAAASPGPAVAAIVARVIARGHKGLWPFILGIIITDVIWLALTVLGLAMLAQTFQEVFLVIRYLGAAYLLWMAWKFWTTPAEAITGAPLEVRKGTLSSLMGGLAIGLGNPKAMVFYLALLPNLIDLNMVTPLVFAELCGLTFAVLSVVFSTYIIAAVRARRLLSSPRALRYVNRGTGVVMAGAAVAVAARS